MWNPFRKLIEYEKKCIQEDIDKFLAARRFLAMRDLKLLDITLDYSALNGDEKMRVDSVLRKQDEEKKLTRLIEHAESIVNPVNDYDPYHP